VFFFSFLFFSQERDKTKQNQPTQKRAVEEREISTAEVK